MRQRKKFDVFEAFRNTQVKCIWFYFDEFLLRKLETLQQQASSLHAVQGPKYFVWEQHMEMFTGKALPCLMVQWIQWSVSFTNSGRSLMNEFLPRKTHQSLIWRKSESR